MINFKGSWDDHFPCYHSSIQMSPNEALYGRRCRSHVGWFDLGQAALIGPYSLLYAMEKLQLIRNRLRTTQSRQKSYDHVKKRELEFNKDDRVFLNDSPMKGVMIFRNKGNLNPRYVGP